MDKKDSLASKYTINPFGFKEVKIESVNFSACTYRWLKENDIDTIEDLLECNEMDLLSVKGSDRNCYNEILKYIRSLSKNSNEENYKAISIKQPIWARDNREVLYEGKFSDLKPEYLEKDKEYIEKMQEAYAAIGKEVINSIRENSDLFSKYAYCFRYFHLSIEKVIKQRNEVDICLVSLIKLKPNKCVHPYIMAYSNDTSIQDDLLTAWNGKESKFEDLHIYKLRKYNIASAVLKFLQWCHFDIKNEYLSYLDNQRDRQRVEGILNLRSQHNTLEEVGSIYGVTRERIRQIESKAVGTFKIWERKHKFLAKVMAECEEVSVIQFDQIDTLLHEYSDILIYLFSLADNDQYYVDFDLEIIVYGDLKYSVRVQNYVDLLPDVFNFRKLSVWMRDLPEKIPESILNRAIESQ